MFNFRELESTKFIHMYKLTRENSTVVHWEDKVRNGRMSAGIVNRQLQREFELVVYMRKAAYPTHTFCGYA